MELKVGALVVVCSILLIGFLVVLGKFRPGQEAMVVIDYETSGGLRIGAPVKLAGIDAGRVEQIDFQGGGLDEELGRRVYVRVTISMKPELRASLREDARFYITTAGLLGEQYVEIDPGRAETVLGNKPVEGIPPMRLEILTANLNRIATLAARILEDNEQNIRDTITDFRQTAQSARGVIDSASGLMKDARATVGRVETKAAKLMDTAITALEEFTPGRGETGNQIKRTTSSAANLVESAEKVFSDGKLITDVAGDARKALRKAGGLADHIGIEVTKVRKKANNTLGEVDTLITDAKKPTVSALTKLDVALTNGKAIVGDVHAVIKQIRSGEGTIGGLLADREMFDDIRELLKDIRRHPWKVLWKE
jgi:phospholipid/cholesterol/gamma-HCH transport system substrate-binding protein